MSVGEITPPVTPRPNILLKKCSSYVGAGIILIRFVAPNTEPEFLLLRGADTGIWSFAKGHPEVIDKGYPFYTAIREAGEETGFQHGQDYTVLGDTLRFGKRFYWFGVLHKESMDTSVSLIPREHSEYRWFSLSAMQRVASNYDVRSWVKKMLTGCFYADLQNLYSVVYSCGAPIISPPTDMPSCTTPDTHLTASDHTASLTY
jgi:8-oxo-dGTP pyrophosphatase MutT (NUDIX family)